METRRKVMLKAKLMKISKMFSLLNCYVFVVWTSCEVSSKPLSGAQWSEPKAKRNITVVMIPREKSDFNDSNIIVAVKSDYKVLSKDSIQLLNLVVKEDQKIKNYSNISCNVTFTKSPDKICRNVSKDPKTAQYQQGKKRTFVKANNSKIENPTVNVFKLSGRRETSNKNYHNDRSSVKKVIDYSTTDNTIYWTSNENSLGNKKSFLFAHLSRRDIESRNKSNNEGISIQNQSQLTSKRDTNINSKLASPLNQNNENDNIKNGWTLTAETQLFGSPSGEKPNEAPICTTIIIQCNPVQHYDVFEEISKMANTTPTTETQSLEVENILSDIEPAFGTTASILTECFPVSRGYINVPAKNAALARKITLEPPIDCASHINVRGQQTCETLTQQDVMLKENDLGLPFIKSEKILINENGKANNINVPMASKDIYTSTGEKSLETALVYGNNPSAYVKKGRTFQPLIPNHDFGNISLLFPPCKLMLKDNFSGKDSYFGKRPSFRTGMNNDNSNNQCDSIASSKTDYLNPGMDPDNENLDIELTTEIKPTTKMSNDVQSNRQFQIKSLAQGNENISEIYTITSTGTTVQRLSADKAQYTLHSESDQIVNTTASRVEKNIVSVSKTTQFFPKMTNKTFTQNSIKFTANNFDLLGGKTKHILNEIDANTTTVINTNTDRSFPLNKPDDIFTDTSGSFTIDNENKTPNPTWVDVTQNENITPLSVNYHEKSVTVKSESFFYESTNQDEQKTSSLAVLIKNTKRNTLQDFQNENKDFTPTKSISLINICDDKAYITKLPLPKKTVHLKNKCISPMENRTSKISTVTMCSKPTRTTSTCKSNSDKVRNLLLNNLPFGMNSKNKLNKNQEKKSDIIIPVGSVKEIVIQIVQNTKTTDIYCKNGDRKV